MDPDQTLADIRHLVAEFDSVDMKWESENTRNEYRAIYAADLMDAFSALDEWLTQSGFPPRDWKHRT